MTSDETPAGPVRPFAVPPTGTEPLQVIATVTATGGASQIDGSTQAPVDAIGRALNHITQHQGATS